MSRKWIAICLLVLGMLLVIQVFPAYAQESTPENDANCVACHTHQYYLYDSGKWFCLCDAPMHCIYCHGGRTDSMVEEEAHEGLVLYPTRGHAERCQNCHEEDYMSRVVAFSSVAGVSNTPQPIITATPVEAAATTTEGTPSFPWLRFSHLESWQWVELGGVMIALVVIAILGYRCWKADCLMKSR